MKISKIVSIILVILLMLAYIFPVTSFAVTSNNGLASDELLKFRDYTIKKNTTISQINSRFGNPKIEGDSAFGGKIYTYYDDTYTWSLHIETNAKGEIKAYGCVGEGFVSNRCSYGDEEDFTYWYLSGTIMTERNGNKIIGVYLYNCSSSEANSYWKEYASDSKYLYELQRHTIVVSKILAKMNNYEFPQTYADEKIFYTSEQLKENGTDIYNYATSTGNTQYISLIISRTETMGYDFPNPIGLGKNTQGYEKASNYKYMLYDVKVLDTESNKRYTTVVAVDPIFLEEKNTVSLTEREQELLSNVKEIYKLAGEHYEQAQNFYNSHNSYFEVVPVYDNLPLTAGEWNENVLELSTDYLNFARVGIGLTPVTLNKEIAECAQYKATLVRYMSEKGMDTGHFPNKPEGVSDEFYNKAQSYMTENLYHGDVQASIINALNDGYGDPVSCGHRYNLLEPSNTEWGVGSAGSGISYGWQAAQKFASSGTYNSVELVAWPSNGIFPLDLAYNGIGNWTAKFYKNYTVSNNTEVTIKCLNNGKTYEITNENKNDSDKFLQATDSRLLTFRDDTIAYSDGDVFEIILHNVKDSSGKTVDYTYRSVFKNLSASSNEATNINVDTTNVRLALGQSKKLVTTVEPSDATNKLMKFTSSNEKVATVRQDGLITAVGNGDATITITCGNITKKVQVSVLPFKDVKDGDWFYDAVKYTYNHKIISGLNPETFAPEENVTRAMLVTILHNLDGQPYQFGTSKFPDVQDTTSYYYVAVKWATANGIVSGYDNGNFGPNDPITREQLAVMLNQYCKYKGKYKSVIADFSRFKDRNKISNFAKWGMNWAVGSEVINGSNGYLNPQGTATRAETAAMLYNFCTRVLK